MVYTVVRALDLLYRRIPPEYVYDALQPLYQTANLFDNRTFLRYAESCYSGYSKEEKELLFQELQNSMLSLERRYGYPCLPLGLGVLLDFTESTLCEDFGEPRCRFSDLDKWREGFLLLGQDAPVCMYLAHHDLQNMHNRTEFGWAATLRTDHHGLNHILAGGVAENHRHLKGSTQLAELSWCALMNNPYGHDVGLDNLGEFLQPVYSRGPADNVWPVNKRIELAAALRSSLFRAVREDSCEGNVRVLFERDYINQLESSKSISDSISILREAYGQPITAPDGSVSVLDYALTCKVYEGCRRSPYRVLAGERSFLYDCFQATLKGAFDESEAELFNLYLMLKTSFRSELVQTNREVGFHNFMLYQNRKSFSWSKTPYEWEAYRMAVNGPLSTQNVVSLESRLGPADEPDDNVQEVASIDTSILFANQEEEELPAFLLQSYNPQDNSCDFEDSPDFYVMHFIKDNDEEPPEEGRLDLRYRHQRLRESVRTQSLALAEALQNSAYFCMRVRGIDACNMELNCRPEVFAQAYRYLSNISSRSWSSGALLPRCEPHLARTYHVGEDFYSIVDGLRAIDEAITFLELRQGDRLGHALALGVDPALHCECKSNVVVMSKQNLLDNMVWLLYRTPELGVSLQPDQRERIRQHAERAFEEIYGDAVRRNGWQVSLRDYYDSMLLRGDDPECYRTMKFVQPTPFEDAYGNYALRTTDPRLSFLRANERVVGLYYLYHFGADERRRGLEAICHETGVEEYSLMSDLQEAMMDLVENKGLIIECNPSSNVLIGTFKRYECHPMFRFNHGSLAWQGLDRHKVHQLKVCINTDDLGIFDTSLEFEYAMILRALENYRGEAGKMIFSETEICDYLCKIRDMGKAAVFPGARDWDYHRILAERKSDD